MNTKRAQYWRIIATDVCWRTDLPKCAAITGLSLFTSSDASGTDLARSGVATASSEYPGGYVASNAIDGNVNSIWCSSGADLSWLQVKLAVPALIRSVSINWYTPYKSVPKSFKIQCSEDGISWTDVAAQSTTSGDQSTSTIIGLESEIPVRSMRRYATLNPNDKGASITLANNNLTAYVASTVASVRSTIGKSSGKWYWEVVQASVVVGPIFGISTIDSPTSAYTGGDANSLGLYCSNGQLYRNTTGSAFTSAIALGDVIGIALDLDAATIAFYKNGILLGSIATGFAGKTCYASASSSGGSAGGFNFNFGDTEFSFAPPAGFNGLYNDVGSVSAKLWRLKATEKSYPNSSGYETVMDMFRLSLYSSKDCSGTDLARSGTTSASSTYVNTNISTNNAVDGDSRTFWANGYKTESGFSWFQVELPSAIEVRSAEVEWLSLGDADGLYFPRAFDLQYSVDGTTWVTAHSHALPPQDSVVAAAVARPVIWGSGSAGNAYAYTSRMTNIPLAKRVEWSDVELLCHFDGSAVDTTGKHVLTSNGLTYKDAIGRSGKVAVFDGVSGYVTSSTAVDLVGDFTVEHEIEIPASTSGIQIVCGQWAQVSGHAGWAVDVIANRICFYLGSYSEGSFLLRSGTLPAGVYKYSVTRFMSTFFFHVGGKLIGIVENSVAGRTLPAVRFAVGNAYLNDSTFGASGVVPFTGSMGELRITNSALHLSSYAINASEVFADGNVGANVKNVTSTTKTRSIAVQFAGSGTSFEAEVVPGNIKVVGTGSPLTITGLAPDTEYTVSVTAIDGSDRSQPSTVVAKTKKLPVAPTQVMATKTGYTSASIAFTKSVDNGTPITGYLVTSSVGGFSATVTDSPAQFSGLAYGTAYTFTVRALCDGDEGVVSAQSNIINTTVRRFDVIDATTLHSDLALSSDKLTVTNSSATGNWRYALSSKKLVSGKWYWELSNVDPSWVMFGMHDDVESHLGQFVVNANNPGTITGFKTATATTVYGFALDLENGALYISQDGVWLNGADPTSGAAKTGKVVLGSGSTYFNPAAGAACRFALSLYSMQGSTSTTSATVNFGASAFKYAPPSGYRDGVFSVEIPPLAPTSLIATADSSTSASIAFTAPTDPDSVDYIPSFTVTSSPEGNQATGTSSPITVSGLDTGVSYTFTVTATNDFGTSPASNPSNAATTFDVPSAPTNVQVADAPGHAVFVTYEVPISNGGKAITSYVATSSPGGLTGTAIPGQPILVSGLSGTVTYTFTVAAVNDIGTGPQSTPSYEYYCPSAPYEPTNVSVMAVGALLHLLSFTAPEPNESGPIIGYTIKSTDGEIDMEVSTSPVLIPVSKYGTDYTYTVCAKTSATVSDMVTTNTVTTQLKSAPAPDYALVADITKPSSVAIYDWNGCQQLANNNATSWSTCGLNAPKSSGKWYWETYFSSNANNAVGIIDWAQAARLTALGYSYTIPSSSAWVLLGYINCNLGNRNYHTPSTIKPYNSVTLGFALDLDNRALYVSQDGDWILGGDPESGSGKVGALVYGFGTPVTPMFSLMPRHSIVVNVGKYQFTNAVPKGYNRGYFTSAIPVEAPSEPTNVRATEVGVDYAVVAFDAPQDNGNGQITGYQVLAYPSLQVVSGTTSPIRVSGLAPETDHTFVVTAINARGFGKPSSASSVVHTAVVPNQPTDVVIEEVGATSMLVSFKAPEFDGGWPVSSYTVESGTVSATGAESPILVTGLTESEQYSFVVRATNTAGNSFDSFASEPKTASGQLVFNRLGDHSFSIKVPIGTDHNDVLARLAQELVAFGWETVDLPTVFRSVNADGTTYKYLRLVPKQVDGGWVATTEVYESWDAATHTGVNRAGPKLDGQRYDDYTKTAFMLSSEQREVYVHVYASERWALIGSCFKTEDRFSFNNVYTFTDAGSDMFMYEHSGMSGAVEFSRDAVEHVDVPCFMWTHTAWMVDEVTVLPGTDNIDWSLDGAAVVASANKVSTSFQSLLSDYVDHKVAVTETRDSGSMMSKVEGSICMYKPDDLALFGASFPQNLVNSGWNLHTDPKEFYTTIRGDLGYSGTNTMSMSGKFEEGVVRFKYCVYCPIYYGAIFKVLVDDVERFSSKAIDNTGTFSEASIHIPAGNHTITWWFKGGMSSYGSQIVMRDLVVPASTNPFRPPKTVTLCDPVSKNQVQSGKFATIWESRDNAVGRLPRAVDAAGASYTNVPVTLATSFFDQMDGRFLRERNDMIPLNIFNGKNPIVDLQIRSPYAFLGTLYGLKLCRPDGVLMPVDHTETLTCDDGYRIAKFGYGSPVEHATIQSRIHRKVVSRNYGSYYSGWSSTPVVTTEFDYRSRFYIPK